jgi:ankyrin repeat protein
MPPHRPVGLWIVVAVLLAVVVVLYVQINSLKNEVASNALSPRRAAASSGSGAGPAHPIDDARAAITAGDAAALKRELDSGADPNALVQVADNTRRHLPLLTYAVMQGNPDAVRALLGKGAKADSISADGWTPLMMASARADQPSFDAILAAAKNSVEMRNKWGQTPLMIASRSGDDAKVKALLAAGASPKSADDEGNTALSMAIAGDAPAPVVRSLLDAHADPDAADREGVTPLMRAAERGDAEKCVLLLSAGAKPELKDHDGRTALQWAQQRADAAGQQCEQVLAGAAH